MGYKFHAATAATYKVVDGVIIGSLRDGNPSLTPHFHANEFACPDCKEYRINVKTLEGLENIRVRGGLPLTVANTTLTSTVNTGGTGYRCPAYNAELCKRDPTASRHSRHMQGEAVDIHPADQRMSVYTLYQLVRTEPVFRDGGIGFYDTFVHADCWHRRRWDNRKHK